MNQPDTRSAPAGARNNSERHNQLLARFRRCWNVYQFYLTLEEQLRDRFRPLNARMMEAFQRFKRCKEGLERDPESAIVTRQLEVLDADVLEIQKFLGAQDDEVTVQVIRQTLQAPEHAQPSALRHLLDYYLAKTAAAADRDKIDYLVTHYFQEQHLQLISPDSLPEMEAELRKLLPHQTPHDVVAVPEMLDQFLSLLREAQKITEFSDFLRLEIFARIRDYKQKLGDHFFNPALLARIILMNTMMRQKFESLLQEENQKTEDHIIKLAEVGGEIVVENNASNLSGLTLLRAKELKNDLTQNLHDEYSKTLDKISTLDQLRDTLERSVAFYGLDVDDSKLGSGFAVKFNSNREEDDLRGAIADLGMMTRANGMQGMSSVRFKYREVLVILSAWEADAFLEGPTNSDLLLRVRQAVRRNVGLIFVIQDILRQYKELQSPGLPRRLLLALEYYLLKAQELHVTLDELTREAGNQGRKLEAFHLSNAQTRLAATVASVKPIFNQSRTA